MKLLVEQGGRRYILDEVDALMHDDDADVWPMVRVTFKGDREDRLFDSTQASIEILPTEPG